MKVSTSTLRTGLLAGAALLTIAAVFLPLWGMVLVSTQYPDGLRMIIYPTRIAGDITELNLLNHYIGMAEISSAYFSELRVLPVIFGSIAAACLLAAALRRRWSALLPMLLMASAAVYGFWSMRARLYEFGHNLDPKAAIDIEPFTPPMIGQNTIAQFASYSYFSWGAFLPMLAGLLVGVAFWLDLRANSAQAR